MGNNILIYLGVMLTQTTSTTPMHTSGLKNILLPYSKVKMRIHYGTIMVSFQISRYTIIILRFQHKF